MKTFYYSLLLLLAFALTAQARTWTAKSGQTVDGEFVKIDGENVVIKLADGNSAAVKLDLLSDGDQQFAQEEEKKRTNPFVIINNTDMPDSDRKAGDRMALKIKEVEYGFRWCPAGKFMMGSPESSQYRESDETQHQVTFTQGFWMLETEVAQGMWGSVMGSNPSHTQDIKFPVEKVSWADCQEYIKKLNGLLAGTPGTPVGFKFSLPTEAQWEYACRAGTTTAFHFGDTLTEEQAYQPKKEVGSTKSPKCSS